MSIELRSASQGIYTVETSIVLTNKDVTPQRWRQAVEQLKAKLKGVAQPDDLVVFFLAGHGVVDEDTRKYYFVGHDFTLADLQEKTYTACLGWDDFRMLADIPCRKLVMLDTCYSGAIQPPRSRDLKYAVRQLQDDVIFTVTAATGEQRSAEKAAWQHGAFTKCLLEALGGRAAEPHDPIITLDEVIKYVKQSVPKLTDGAQTPTAAPDEVLPYTSLAADPRAMTAKRNGSRNRSRPMPANNPGSPAGRPERAGWRSNRRLRRERRAAPGGKLGGWAEKKDVQYERAAVRHGVRIAAWLLLLLAMIVGFIVWLVWTPLRTPILVAVVTNNDAALPPNAWAQEDAERLEALDQQQVLKCETIPWDSKELGIAHLRQQIERTRAGRPREESGD